MKRFIFTGIIILFVMAGCGGDHSSTDGLITVDVNDSYSTKKELVLAFTSKNSMAPKAEGIPYDKGSR